MMRYLILFILFPLFLSSQNVMVDGSGNRIVDGSGNIWISSPINKPDCTTPVNPTDTEIDIATSVTLEWNAVSLAYGYKLEFDGGAVEDLGNVLTHLVSSLSNETEYSWKITPYGYAGDAVSCTEWTFTTIAGFSNTKYASLDGTDEFIVYEADKNLSTTHSVSCWFKLDGTPNTYNSFAINGTSNTSYITFRSAHSLNYKESVDAVVTVAYTDDTNWHLFTLTRSGTSVKFFIDGSQVGVTQTLAGNNDFVLRAIGGHTTTRMFKGFVDEFCTFSTELSAGDITTLYGGGTPQTAGDPETVTGLTHYVNFEQTRTTLVDAINGTLTATNMEDGDIIAY